MYHRSSLTTISESCLSEVSYNLDEETESTVTSATSVSEDWCDKTGQFNAEIGEAEEVSPSLLFISEGPQSRRFQDDDMLILEVAVHTEQHQHPLASTWQLLVIPPAECQVGDYELLPIAGPGGDHEDIAPARKEGKL